ncbi:MAG: hypothetical protein Kow0010_09490 [Dehalococcoidia bacterium]
MPEPCGHAVTVRSHARTGQPVPGAGHPLGASRQLRYNGRARHAAPSTPEEAATDTAINSLLCALALNDDFRARGFDVAPR